MPKFTVVSRYKWKCAAVIFGALTLLSGCAGQAMTNTPELKGITGSEPYLLTGGKGMEALKPTDADYKVDDYEQWNQLLKENEISGSFKVALNQFAFQSGSQMLADSEGNVNFSPLSLYYAMALAGCGAEGDTAKEITDILGIQDQGQLADECKKLYQSFYYSTMWEKARNEAYGEGEFDSTIQLGNSLWVSDQLSVKEEFEQTAALQFFASSYQVDFTGEEAGKQIGSWIAEQTKGVLKPEIKLPEETMMTIINTLYFYGGWRDTFSAAETADDSFTKADGSRVTVPFMNRVNSMGSFRTGEGYTVSSLSTDNSCSMVFLLPDEGRSVDDFLSQPEQLQAALAGDEDQWQNGEVTWKVPKFSFGSSFKLADLLKSLGVEKMFIPEVADFSGISELPLYVDEVIQETHIGIDEDGVEGAAYTMIIMEGGAAMPDDKKQVDMILDRPFIYGIQDDDTGTWLFLGVCRDPSIVD